MKAVQVTAPGEFEIVSVPKPEPGHDEVVIQVEAVTTCPQWDLHLRHNEPMFVGHRFTYPYPPGQPGHEATGRIHAVGSGVTGLSPGDRVSAWRDPGPRDFGGYADYLRIKADSVIRVPEGLPWEATAPVELAMCVGSVFLTLREMRCIEGREYAVGGLGPAGLIAAQMLRAEGAASVVGFDLSEKRRVQAVEWGLVDAAHDPRAVGTEYPARPAGPALDGAVDCVGAKASVEFLMDRVRDVVALFGVQREEYTFGIRHYSGLRLIGYSGHRRAAAEYAVDLISAGQLDLARLSTHHLPLERYNEGIERLETQEAIKICFRPGWTVGGPTE